jgi:amidase
MGSQTYNTVYGTTLNPYDPDEDRGRIERRAAAALASGMLPIADGGDLGGSLRNPGQLQQHRRAAAQRRPGAAGADADPVRRRVDERARWRVGRGRGVWLSVMAGADARDAQSCESDPSAFAGRLDRDWRGAAIAWSLDLGGLPLDRRVRRFSKHSARPSKISVASSKTPVPTSAMSTRCF